VQLVAINLFDIFARGVEQRIGVVVAVDRLRPIEVADPRGVGFEIVLDLP
jgi:hypothetical protein